MVEVATHHCNELGCVLKQVNADEHGVMPCSYLVDGMRLHSGRPFKVSPELGSRAVSTSDGEA